MGEVSTKGNLHYEQIAREVVKEVGYDDEAKGLDYKNMSVLLDIEA